MPVFSQYGYGSIPINTIFRGMNIQLNQLFWCSPGVLLVLTHCHMYKCLSLSFHQWWSFAVAAPQVHLFLKKAFERLSEALRVSVFAQAIGVPGNGPTVYWSFLLLTVIDPEFWAIAILHQKLHQIAQVIAAPAPLVLFKFLQGRQDVAAGVQGHLGKREVKLSWGIMGYINVSISLFFLTGTIYSWNCWTSMNFWFLPFKMRFSSKCSLSPILRSRGHGSQRSRWKSWLVEVLVSTMAGPLAVSIPSQRCARHRWFPNFLAMVSRGCTNGMGSSSDWFVDLLTIPCCMLLWAQDASSGEGGACWRHSMVRSVQLSSDGCWLKTHQTTRIAVPGQVILYTLRASWYRIAGLLNEVWW